MDIFIVKENLINNLCTGLIPHILDGFMSIYEDALRVNPRNSYEQNKRFLLEIKNWPQHIVTTETKRIITEFKMLRKVIKTINFINIKSLSLIGKNNINVDDKYISKNTPQVDKFIHNIYTNSSKEFFHDEQLMNFGISGTRTRQAVVIENVIKRLLNEAVPINDLLYNIVDYTDESLTPNIQAISKPFEQPLSLLQKTKAISLMPSVHENDIEDDESNEQLVQKEPKQIKQDDGDEEDEQDEDDDYISTVVSNADTENIIIENTRHNHQTIKEDTLDMLQNTLVNMSSTSSNKDQRNLSQIIANNKSLQSFVGSDVLPPSSHQTTDKTDKNSNTKTTMRSLRNKSTTISKSNPKQ